MSLIQVGATAPPVAGASLQETTAVVFYKVTCPVCQMAAPVIDLLERSYPGRVVGVGQDPVEALGEFARDFEMRAVASRPDLPPYEMSNAYGIESVPTVVLVDGGRVVDVVPAWDRDGYNRVSAELAASIGAEPVVISKPGDGLPPYRPG